MAEIKINEPRFESFPAKTTLYEPRFESGTSINDTKTNGNLRLDSNIK